MASNMIVLVGTSVIRRYSTTPGGTSGGKEIMGNIRDNTIEEIWNGPRYKEFRTRLLESVTNVDKEPELCKSCLKWTHKN